MRRLEQDGSLPTLVVSPRASVFILAGTVASGLCRVGSTATDPAETLHPTDPKQSAYAPEFSGKSKTITHGRRRALAQGPIARSSASDFGGGGGSERGLLEMRYA